MTNKRNLKKRICDMCGEVAGACLYTEAGYNADAEKVGELVVKIALLQETTVKNVSFSFDKTPKDFENKPAYNVARAKYNQKAFSTLKEGFLKELQSLVTELNALVPTEVKAGHVK